MQVDEGGRNAGTSILTTLRPRANTRRGNHCANSNSGVSPHNSDTRAVTRSPDPFRLAPILDIVGP